jgi:hypothetical protein
LHTTVKTTVLPNVRGADKEVVPSVAKYEGDGRKG